MAEKTIEAHAADLHQATSLFLNYSVQHLIAQGTIQPSEKNALMREYSKIMAEKMREFDRTFCKSSAPSSIFSY
ncbi:hypothetical protein [Rodentibacter myodis]|uniref:Uncharacterized protein n=1 Tax=Rodentibacter myodis TaxID=1907939 RepID=A0A1V3JKV3_9PAST|nr:hypothetical protein [Rodentibacter myodis]OOF57314.1 hypothetical protein BKL49_09545 [Rodentibacter myodis]